MNNKISVIMAAYLGEYEGAATNRKAKFERAIRSFLQQGIPDKELIVVVDGCDIAKDIIVRRFDAYCDIRWVYVSKQERFSGNVRAAGVEAATGDIICYLDTDDYFLPEHLKFVRDSFRLDWIYFDDYLNCERRKVKLRKSFIGCSNIAHKRELDVTWRGCNGYGHDWEFIQQLMSFNSAKGKGAYNVCHIPNQLDV